MINLPGYFGVRRQLRCENLELDATGNSVTQRRTTFCDWLKIGHLELNTFRKMPKIDIWRRFCNILDKVQNHSAWKKLSLEKVNKVSNNIESNA